MSSGPSEARPACRGCADREELAYRLAVAALSRGHVMPRPDQADDFCTVPAVARIEAALLGTFLVSPELLDAAALLTEQDFSSPFRAAVFVALRSFPRRRFDIPLVAAELERRHLEPPPGFPGWVSALSKLTDEIVWEDDLLPDYVLLVKGAAAVRRAGIRKAS